MTAATYRRAQSQTSSVWIGRIFMITAFTFLTFNMTGYSLYGLAAWLMGEWNSIDGGSGTYLILLALLTISVGALWLYVFKKAWQGAGSKLILFIIVPVIFGLLLSLLVTADLMDPLGAAFISLIQLAVGLSLGIMFSFNFIDRAVSGTTATTTTVLEDDSGAADHHHHDN